MNIRIGRISKLLSPGTSWCQRCHTTWAFVQPHTVRYNEIRGIFCLCTKCNSELAPADKLPYYERVAWQGWRKKLYWEQIERAVLSDGCDE